MDREVREEDKQMMDTAKVIEMEQVYFRPEEAAEYLRVGRTTMYAMLKSGLVPSITYGKSRIVRRVDLDDFVSRKLVEQADRKEQRCTD